MSCTAQCEIRTFGRALVYAVVWTTVGIALHKYDILMDLLVVDEQVMQMFDKAEAEYRELSEKKRIVENDKEKIKRVRAAVIWLFISEE